MQTFLIMFCSLFIFALFLYIPQFARKVFNTLRNSSQMQTLMLMMTLNGYTL